MGRGRSVDVEIPTRVVTQADDGTSVVRPGPTLIAIAMTNGPEWDQHCAALRLRSYHDALRSGRIRT